MKTTQTSQTASTAPTVPTPHICVSAHFYGTGASIQESRKNLVKAGGSPQEDQTVYKLPDGATNAYVAGNGTVYWYGTEGEMKPVFHYVKGKAVAWKMGEDKPIPYKKPEGKGSEPRHSPTAQDEGAVHPEPETTAESTIASTPAPQPEATKPAAPARVKSTKP